MKWISTTIKKKWMDKILSGEKKIEYKGATEFWLKRLDSLFDDPKNFSNLGINFLCGRKAYKFKVESVTFEIKTEGHENIDGKLFREYFKIEIGERIKEVGA